MKEEKVLGIENLEIVKYM